MIEPTEIVSHTASEDPEVGLRAVASLRALLEAVEELQVRRARERGWSWQQIAALLGVSKQAAHQKYGTGERRRGRRLRRGCSAASWATTTSGPSTSCSRSPVTEQVDPRTP